MAEPRKGRFSFADLKTPGGYLVGEVTSAMQKDIRRGNEREALFWATELSMTGYTNYVFKRLRLIASEDIGVGDNSVAILVRVLYDNWVEQKKADGGEERNAAIFLIHAVQAMCQATKSRRADTALVVMNGNRELIPIPDYALDVHTKRGRKMGRTNAHFYAEAGLVSPESRLADPYLAEAIVIDEHEEKKKRGKSAPSLLDEE